MISTMQQYMELFRGITPLDFRYQDPETELQEYLVFANKREYLEWVFWWKNEYVMVSHCNRKLDERVKQLQRAGLPAWRQQYNLVSSKALATTLLILRRMGKERSWRMKQQSVT
jgi:hypothetical protein